MERELAAQKAAEAEALKKRQQQEAEDRAARLEFQRRQALINELTHSLAQDVMETVVIEEVKVASMSTMYQSRKLKKKMEPYLDLARTRIHRQRHLASERKYLHQLVDRFSKHRSKPSCKAIKQQRVRESLYLEKRMVYENLKRVSVQDSIAAVWQFENYAQLIHPVLQFSSSGPKEWQLWIHVENLLLESTKWFAHKFGLDTEFGRRVERSEDGSIITLRTVSPQSCLYSKAIDEMGGIIFSLSETRTPGTDDTNNPKYWRKEKERLDQMTKQLLEYNPRIRIPIIITYWPQTDYLENAVQEIPNLLGLHDNLLIIDYHLIIMDPATIAGRLSEEIVWLASTSSNIIHTCT
ncbi:hypothetical protein BDC45DRAFT_314092 [Circinella umbellata]|nr:hypothetical protein BDC45DRAFT_314092 [Circinella umbellata]